MQFPRTGLRLAFLSDSRCPGAKPDSPDGPDISRVGGTSPNLAIAPLAYPQRSATSEQRSQRPKGQANESHLERELELAFDLRFHLFGVFPSVPPATPPPVVRVVRVFRGSNVSAFPLWPIVLAPLRGNFIFALCSSAFCRPVVLWSVVPLFALTFVPWSLGCPKICAHQCLLPIIGSLRG